MATWPKGEKASLNWSLLFLLSTAYLGLSLNVQGLMSLMPLIRVEFALSRAQSGLYSSFFFTSATVISVFTGSIVDKVGAKKGILIGILTVGFLMILHSLPSSYTLLLLLAFLTGIGFSVITPAVNKGVMEAVAPQKRTVSLGIMQSGMGIGGFLGASLLPPLAQVLGWRNALISSGLFSILIGVFITFFLQLEKRQITTLKESSSPSLTWIIKGFLKNKALLGLCFLGLVFGAATSAITAHLSIFLHQDLGLHVTMAGLGLALLHLGGIIGRPGWGILGDGFFAGNRPKTLYSIGYSVGLIGILLGVLTGNALPIPLIFFFVFLLGATTMGCQALLFVAISEESGAHTGTATGLALLFIRLGVLSSPPLFGLLADLYGSYGNSWIVLGLFVLVINILVYHCIFRKRGK